MSNHICLIIAYDGNAYCGFQLQPRKITVQGRLEEALQRVTGENVKIHGSGRTDAGVHARAQYVHFATSANIPIDRWCLALNSCLPDDIVVKKAIQVPAEFHARKSALAKTYRYTVNFGRMQDALLKHLQYHFPRTIDLERIREASKCLIGEHDFRSFAATNSVRRSYIRHIHDIRIQAVQIEHEPDRYVVDFFVTGNGFLQHMVRILIGTLLEVGVGKKCVQDVQTTLLAQNRLLAGPTAPPHGLILWDVLYPARFKVNLESFH